MEAVIPQPLVFFFITVLIGGAAAWATGRAIASTWRPRWQMLTYSLLLAGAARFLHFSLFEGELFGLLPYIADFIVLYCFAELGFRFMRSGQMAGQYGWLYERRGLLGWRVKDNA
jgi:hypothetical protein